MVGDSNKNLKTSGDIDIYRNTPIRLLGYANEVGEAFRSLVHRNLVRLSYVVAFSYVLADTHDKTKRIQDPKTKLKTGADVLIWQTLASVAIPGFTINRICAAAAYFLHKFEKLSPMKRKWTTTAIGLCCIPLIVKPIDHSVDILMDQTYRKYW